jgi:hypothetical protein
MNIRNKLFTLLLIFATEILMSFVPSPAAKDEIKVYIFYPLTTSPMIIQHKIAETCVEIKPTVFGRYQDFKDRTETDRPDIIITKPQILQDVPGYSIRMNGLKKGSSEEQYVLLSIDKKIPPDSIPSITIGAVDFLGRSNTEKFVTGMLHCSVHLNRVTKIEDLLPMLSFNKSQAIFVNEGSLPYFKQATYLKLIVTKIPNCNAGIITCAVQSQNRHTPIDDGLNTIAKKTTVILEIDQWKTE